MSVELLPANTVLPGSTSRSPTRPAIGDDDVAILELHPVVRDGPFVGLHGALVLDDRLLLVVELLFGDGVFGVGVLVTLQVHAGLGEQALVVLQTAFGLFQRRLRGARIDVDERLALAHHLAFLVMHFHHPAGDLTVDSDRVGRCHGAERVHVDADITGPGLPDRDGRVALLVAAPGGLRRGLGEVVQEE